MCQLNKAIYCLRRVTHFVSPKSLKALYFSLFHSHLLYFPIILNCISQTNLAGISRLQRKPSVLYPIELIMLILNLYFMLTRYYPSKKLFYRVNCSLLTPLNIIMHHQPIEIHGLKTMLETGSITYVMLTSTL
jgi:hypothetical protein